MSKFWAGLIVVVTTGLSAALFFEGKVGGSEGNLGVTLSVVLGVVVGAAVGVGIVAFIEWLPWSRRFHWQVHHEVLTFGGTMGVCVQSRHWHTVRGLRCEIRSPDGAVWTPEANFGKPQLVLGPGHRSGIQTLPDAGTGKYRIKWIIDPDDGTKPIVIAKRTYRVQA